MDRIHKQMQKKSKKYENNMKKYENQPGACQRLKNGGFEEFLKCSLRGSCLFLVTLFSYFFIFAKIGFSHFIFQEFIRFIFFSENKPIFNPWQAPGSLCLKVTLQSLEDPRSTCRCNPANETSNCGHK